MEDETKFEIDTLLDHDFRVIRTGRRIVAAGFVLGMTIAAQGIHDRDILETLGGYFSTASGLLPGYLYMKHKFHQLQQEPLREPSV
jgi:hypothetical protein